MQLRIVTLGRAALLVAATASWPAAAMPQGDTAEAAFERYRTQINTHDFDRLARDVIAPDAWFVFTDKQHRGVDEARAAFQQTWATLPDEVYTMSEPQWLARGDNSAVVVFRYAYKGTLKSGQTVAGGGHGTNLYKRTPAGWRLAYEHLSYDPKPATTTAK